MRHLDTHNAHYVCPFQSTHPRGVRPEKIRVCTCKSAVSIHAPTWGATTMIVSGGFFGTFQSTHPRGVRLKQIAQPISSQKFQSTHPRGVRPSVILPTAPRQFVSIHAPTWGATTRYVNSCRSVLFQSTHPRGVRRCPCPRTQPTSCFNPRTHVGCDQRVDRLFKTDPSFNPRTHVGCDIFSTAFLISSSEFQSTHPRGVRPFWILERMCVMGVSIHAPTWGATSRPHK